MRNKKKEAIIGRTVMVHPHLTTDPIEKQGECGTIIAAFPSKDTLMVVFADKTKGEYAPEALLTLLPSRTIKRNWLKSFHRLTEQTNSRLSKIFLMACRKEHEPALRLSVKSIGTEALATLNCRNWMEQRGQAKKQHHRYRR